MDYKDVAVRAGKTAVQSFLGVLIPASITYLNGGFPESWDAAWVWLAPVVSSALAASISAIWNTLQQYWSIDE